VVENSRLTTIATAAITAAVRKADPRMFREISDQRCNEGPTRGIRGESVCAWSSDPDRVGPWARVMADRDLLIDAVRLAVVYLT
jgi:hypothetical protein